MLYEAPPFYVINGVSIASDHEDPLQHYYTTLSPRFVSRRDGALDVPQMSLIKYRSQSRIGGLADFDVHLGLSDEELADIRRQLQRLAGLDELPRLSPVPVVDGSVKLMIFGRMSGDKPGEDDAGFVRG